MGKMEGLEEPLCNHFSLVTNYCLQILHGKVILHCLIISERL